jgi:general secretion pathway protein H
MVSFGATGFRLDDDVPIAWPAQVSPAGDRVINFSPDGGSSGGLIVLRGEGRQVAIGVDWLTGRVRAR